MPRVAVSYATGDSELSRAAAGLAVTVPVAVYLALLRLLHIRPYRGGVARQAVYPVAVALELAAAFTPSAVLVAGLFCAAMVAATILA